MGGHRFHMMRRIWFQKVWGCSKHLVPCKLSCFVTSLCWHLKGYCWIVNCCCWSILLPPCSSPWTAVDLVSMVWFYYKLTAKHWPELNKGSYICVFCHPIESSDVGMVFSISNPSHSHMIVPIPKIYTLWNLFPFPYYSRKLIPVPVKSWIKTVHSGKCDVNTFNSTLHSVSQC